MKVLLTCVPGFGHFHPMVPLAQALVAAGHEVAFATAERFCRRVVEPAGFVAIPAGWSPPRVFEATLRLPGIAGARQAGQAGQPGQEDGEADTWRFGARMFAEVAAPAKVADLVDGVRTWGADLLVHDMTDFAGPIAAAATGIPWANHGFGALQPDEFWDLAADVIAPSWQAWGLESPPLGGMFSTLYLDVCPPSFQSATIRRVLSSQPLRPVAFDNPTGRPLPPWVEAAERPIVYVTLGTVANHATEVFDTVLAGLRDLGGTVIVTVGPDRHPAELGPQPPNVHVEPYLPQSLLLPSCALVVCHGGSGTTLAALGAGVPMLVVPQEANQFWNADRTALLGTGEQLRPAELTAAAVEGEVRRLLDDPAYRSAAQGLAAEIVAMPSPEEVVDRIVALPGSGRPRSVG